MAMNQMNQLRYGARRSRRFAVRMEAHAQVSPEATAVRQLKRAEARAPLSGS
jgi:hypothetical protein